MIYEYDIVVIGGGIAGLYTALTASENTKVAVIGKVHITRSQSVAAQGGIAASLGNEEEDHWKWHMYDTVKGSDYLADQTAVEILTKEAPNAIYTLENLGVPFSRNAKGKINQRRFGGHTKNFGEAPIKRACYISDHTGRAIMDTLYDQCLRNGVTMHNEVFIQKLLFRLNNCCGAAGFIIASGTPSIFNAKSVVLATGGCGKIYKTTSNGHASTGDGFALVLDAHLPLEDMEFVQFHPTGIYGLGILISEAARAEGGVLRNGDGDRFMERYAPTLKDLAPRDIVSRAIIQEIREGKGIDGRDYVHLDLRNIGKEKLKQTLPQITSLIKTYLGLDPSETMIPVAPTCHYIMGGIPIDLEGHVLADTVGNIVPGLYAAGECACASIHGANRLGCNSLIDLVVFGRRVALTILKEIKQRSIQPLPLQFENIILSQIDNLLKSTGNERVPVLREKLQYLMNKQCNVFRNGQTLKKTIQEIRNLKKQLLDVGLTNKSRIFNYELQEALELTNMLKVAEVIAFSALQRKESRGAHYRNDYPERNDENVPNHTFVIETASGLKQNYKPVVLGRIAPEKRMY